jgi:ribonuclease BN (tRNA processing enzyme)
MCLVMQLRVLGCHGGELPGCRTTCLLIDGHTAIDAGALTATLTLDALMKVDDIFLTHSHFDHVKDVPLLTDLVIGRRTTPVLVHGTKPCMDTMKNSIFNDELWPDFTKIPTAANAVITLNPFVVGDVVHAKDLQIQGIGVKHPVDSVGYIVTKGDRSIAISGDTGPTQALWDAVNARTDIAAVFIELSFPNDLQWLADVSGHFTPKTLAAELHKIRGDMPVYLYHLKPAFLEPLHREVAALGNPRLQILQLDDVFEF